MKKNLKTLYRVELNSFLRTVALNSSILDISDYKKKQLLKCVVLYKTSFLHKYLKKNFSSFSFFTSQCVLTWRTRSVYSFFKLSRMCIRELSAFGFLKGVRKSSW
jgi:ribosomal protein S14